MQHKFQVETSLGALGIFCDGDEPLIHHEPRIRLTNLQKRWTYSLTNSPNIERFW